MTIKEELGLPPTQDYRNLNSLSIFLEGTPSSFYGVAILNFKSLLNAQKFLRHALLQIANPLVLKCPVGKLTSFSYATKPPFYFQESRYLLEFPRSMRVKRKNRIKGQRLQHTKIISMMTCSHINHKISRSMQVTLPVQTYDSQDDDDDMVCVILAYLDFFKHTSANAGGVF